MDVLEQRKYEAILFTFKQVSKYFQVRSTNSDLRFTNKLVQP